MGAIGFFYVVIMSIIIVMQHTAKGDVIQPIKESLGPEGTGTPLIELIEFTQRFWATGLSRTIFTAYISMDMVSNIHNKVRAESVKRVWRVCGILWCVVCCGVLCDAYCVVMCCDVCGGSVLQDFYNLSYSL